MCGFVGIVSASSVAAEIYDALISIQHRGQDAAGIMTYEADVQRLHLEKGEGLVRDAFKPRQIERLRGTSGLGHTRYPTVGSGGVEDAQPMLVSSPYGIGLVHNGNITNYHALRRELFERDARFVTSGCDAEVLLATLACALDRDGVRQLKPADIFAAVRDTFARALGAYSAVALIAGQGMVAFRDPFGIKPIVMGTRVGEDGRNEYGFASESSTLSLLGFTHLEDVGPGEAIWIDTSRVMHRARLSDRPHRPCVFEYVYFARPDATLDGTSVFRARQRAGIALAKTWRASGRQADIVVPVPDSACTAAQELARELGLPYREALVKNRYVGRTFIMPASSDRRKSVRRKLNPIPAELEGQRVLLVDDSIVRGNTARELVRMVRDAGAREVFLASYSPPLKHPCIYGIDMSTRDEFIARDHSVDEIARMIGVDHLVYQSLEGLEEACRPEGNPGRRFCNACFTGDYPTGDVTAEQLAAWEADRRPSGTSMTAPPSLR